MCDAESRPPDRAVAYRLGVVEEDAEELGVSDDDDDARLASARTQPRNEARDTPLESARVRVPATNAKKVKRCC